MTTNADIFNPLTTLLSKSDLVKHEPFKTILDVTTVFNPVSEIQFFVV